MIALEWTGHSVTGTPCQKNSTKGVNIKPEITGGQCETELCSGTTDTHSRWQQTQNTNNGFPPLLEGEPQHHSLPERNIQCLPANGTEPRAKPSSFSLPLSHHWGQQIGAGQCALASLPFLLLWLQNSAKFVTCLKQGWGIKWWLSLCGFGFTLPTPMADTYFYKSH
jgi:hypothetical protein